jgi:hypothetical protein
MAVIEPGRERRRYLRVHQALPVRVSGHDAAGEAWQEACRTREVGKGGVSLMLSHASFKGQVLRLELPLPEALRDFDRSEPEVSIYGIVRDCVEGHGTCKVGVMFFGKQPPRGFERTPGAAFLLPGDVPAAALAAMEPDGPHAPRDGPTPSRYVDGGPGRRRHERLQMYVAFNLQQVDEWGSVLSEERALTENLSLGGARLKTTGRFAPGEVVVLRHASGSFETRAEVKVFFVGIDGGRHLGVMFLDENPEHLLRSR